jgi:poly-gamma-glutamate capsule biosynthesis protein CapA/YwtB (metallophosphatase superfamily)
LKAVRPYTIKGKILCFVIVSLCKIVHVFKKKTWSTPRQFEENPKTMTKADLIYFAYKYYFAPPLKPCSQKDLAVFNQIISEKEVGNQLLSISIGGDLMPYELIKPELTKNLWQEIGDSFFSSDIVFANLETPLDANQTIGFVPEVMLNDMLFNANETMFDIFNGNGEFKGFDVLSIANNHSLDRGSEGLKNTMDFLTQKEISYVGARKTETENAWKIIEKNGIKVAFLAYTYSLNQFDVPKDEPWIVNLMDLNKEKVDVMKIKKDVINCKNSGAELVICSLHCGNAYQAYPSTITIELFKRVFNECGVDVIAGGHPHNPQPSMTYEFLDPISGNFKKGFAIFSLGDFVAYDIFTWCHLSAFLKILVFRDSDNKINFNVKINYQYLEYTPDGLIFKDVTKGIEKISKNNEFTDIKELYDILNSPFVA